jgi:hypothetical protein
VKTRLKTLIPDHKGGTGHGGSDRLARLFEKRLRLSRTEGKKRTKAEICDDLSNLANIKIQIQKDLTSSPFTLFAPMGNISPSLPI